MTSFIKKHFKRILIIIFFIMTLINVFIKDEQVTIIGNVIAVIVVVITGIISKEKKEYKE